MTPELVTAVLAPLATVAGALIAVLPALRRRGPGQGMDHGVAKQLVDDV